MAAMALAKKQNKGLIFENRNRATVNDLLPDDEANKAFEKTDGNITGVEWEAEIQEPSTHIPQINNNQYAAMAVEEGNEYNDTESTGVDNDGEITGVQQDKEITGVDSDNESAESGITGATNEAGELALIEEAISESQRDIAEGPQTIHRGTHPQYCHETCDGNGHSQKTE